MNCSKCGTQNPDDSNFCIKCGNNLKTENPILHSSLHEKRGTFEQLDIISEEIERLGFFYKLGFYIWGLLALLFFSIYTLFIGPIIVYFWKRRWPRNSLVKAFLYSFIVFFTLYLIIIPIWIISLFALTGIESNQYEVKPYVPPIQEIPIQEINYNITIYPGSIPVIDGNIINDERWYEGTNIQVNAGGKSYMITMKHDRENLYILMHWEDAHEWNENISLFFEQDDGRPDFNLKTGRVDWYYQNDGSDPVMFGDGHYKSGFISDQHQDGSLAIGYSGEWIMEWKIPLNSGDKDDIFVNRYPTVLGFSIINSTEGESGILPPDAYRSNSRTWASLEIVNEKRK